MRVRKHRLSRFHKYKTFIVSVLQRPFSTLTEMAARSIQAVWPKLQRRTTSSRKTVWSARYLLGKKFHHLAKSYLVTTRGLFYWQMLFLRAKLQFYRVKQIYAVQMLAKSLRKHPGLHLLLLSYAAYYGYFRGIYAFQRPTEEECRIAGRELLPQPRLEVLWKRFDQGFREFLKFQMYDNLFSNTWIDNRTGKALWDLTQVPRYQVLITDLFLLMYRQQGFCQDTERLTLRIVNDYLSSDFATKNMSDLTVNQALRDT